MDGTDNSNPREILFMTWQGNYLQVTYFKEASKMLEVTCSSASLIRSPVIALKVPLDDLA